MDTTTLVALGIPGLIGALALAVPVVSRGLATAAERRANAALATANAKKLEAEAKKLEAEAARSREETTGRFAKVAEDGYRDAREDLSECEQVREALRIEIDVERRARITLAAECSQREKSAERNIAALRERVEELERRSVRPEA